MVQAAATTLQEYGPMRTAMEKISSAAMIAHDRGHGSEVFKDGCPLDVAAFAGLLRRNFGLKLSPAELGALLVLFDRDGDGTISCDEFKSMWMRLGRAQRSRERKHRSDEAVQARAREDKRLRSHLRKHRPERHKVASAFTEADTDRDGEVDRQEFKLALASTDFAENNHHEWGFLAAGVVLLLAVCTSPSPTSSTLSR